jgi:hypothetical protein
MLHGSSRFITATRAIVASATMLTALTVSLGVVTTNGYAFGSSPFCKTLLNYEEHDASKATPPTSMAQYHTWAASLVPFYEKLASEAPSAGAKATLNEVVVILKWESKKQSITSLEAYISANKKKFEAGTKELAKAIEACA